VVFHAVVFKLLVSCGTKGYVSGLQDAAAEGYTGCPRRNGQNFGRVFLMLNYTDITQNIYIQS